MKENLLTKLIYLYGETKGVETVKKLQSLIAETKEIVKPKRKKLWSEKDIALILYPDSFRENRKPTLQTLNSFLRNYVGDLFNIVHILPFFPFSSDRGFAITDYLKVRNKFGDWKDIARISSKYRLMADFVSNHVSQKHKWFRSWLKGSKKYKDFFIWFSPDKLPAEDQIKLVRRGRTTPLLNPFKTRFGTKYLWTTYSIGGSIDQIDLNYRNPEVFLAMAKIFLFYLDKGISVLRLDGIGGLWKQLGTSCKHLPQNHVLVSVFRDILKALKANTLILTETTTGSFEECISYANCDEAHAVYNFALAPLILLSFYSGSSEELSKNAQKFNLSRGSTFLNVLDVHDGINMYAASKVLNKKSLRTIFKGVARRGAKFSYRNLANGKKEIKEIHVTWWSAINGDGIAPFEVELQRFLTSRAIAMSLKGIPALYYLSLFGAENDFKSFNKTKRGRDMNRTNFAYNKIMKKLSESGSRESLIFFSLKNLIEKRKIIKAFHPDARQKILFLNKRVFAVLRGEGKERVLALHNVSSRPVRVSYGNKKFELAPFAFSWNVI